MPSSHAPFRARGSAWYLNLVAFLEELEDLLHLGVVVVVVDVRTHLDLIDLRVFCFLRCSAASSAPRIVAPMSRNWRPADPRWGRSQVEADGGGTARSLRAYTSRPGFAFLVDHPHLG